MAGRKKYTQTEREFILALALATRKPFTHLQGIVRGLAEARMLSWLGPGANERFLDWPAWRGYSWAKRYGWKLKDIEIETPAPLPKEEEIDDQILRDRLKVKEIFLIRITDSVGDPYRNSNALYKITGQIEDQITRRMTVYLTPAGIVDLVMKLFARVGEKKVSNEELMGMLAEEIGRYRYLSA